MLGAASNVAWWINAISAVTVIFSIAKYWYLGKGIYGVQEQCWIQFVTCFLQLGYNVLIFQTNPDLWGSLLYQPLLVWGILMAMKGLHNARPPVH